MWLHARGGRAVLADDPADDEAPEARREVDPRSLALASDLTEALHEWARVAGAVVAAGQGSDTPAGDLVSRRGRQLAGRLAAAMRTAVFYTDPVTGEVSEIAVPVEPRRDDQPPADEPEPEPPPAEPTPWSTGLTVTVIVAVLVAIVVVALSVALGDASRWLAVAANVVIGIGLAPSVWLARRTPVWRWVAYGVVVGLGFAWLALLFSLL